MIRGINPLTLTVAMWAQL